MSSPDEVGLASASPALATPHNTAWPLPAALSGGRLHADRLHIALFGRVQVDYAGRSVPNCSVGKVQELFCYLLLHRDRPHPRESIASVLWGDQCTTAQSKKYLRQTLWQLQSGLHACPGVAEHFLVAEADWIQLNTIPLLHLDVDLLEAAYGRVRDVPGAGLHPAEVAVLRAASDEYAGDLLDGWYAEWCLSERERLRQVYLLVLDKLMEDAERRHHFEAGIALGERSLSVDSARERTYQHLMRLHLAIGDRTGALRQFDRCAVALREEFDVAPSARTRDLREAVLQDAPGTLADSEPGADAPSRRPIVERLDRILRLQRRMASVQRQIQREIEAVEVALQHNAD